MVRISKDRKREIKKYLSLDEDSLYLLLPRPPRTHRGGLESSKAELEAKKEVFKKLKPSLYQIICVNWRFCSKIKNPALQEGYTLFVIIADLLPSLSIGISPFLLTAILFKIGLKKFCNCK